MSALKVVIAVFTLLAVGCDGLPSNSGSDLFTGGLSVSSNLAKIADGLVTPYVNRTRTLKVLDNVRLLFDMLGIRNYACKKYFVCRVGQFFSAEMSLKERLMRLVLEFPLASLIVLDDVLTKPEVAETLATAVGGFTSHSCNEELYELCRSYHGRRSNFTETFTGRFIRQLLVDQDITNKLDHSLMAAAQQELSNGFWKLVNSYMISGHQATQIRHESNPQAYSVQ